MWPHDVLSRLDRLRPCPAQPNAWTARCPAHDDRHPSLLASVGRTGALVFLCRAGCPVERILESLGLKMADLFPPESRTSGPYDTPGARSAKPTIVKQLVEAYDYTDEAGNLLYQSVRYRLPDGDKSFAQRRPGPDGVGWTWSLGDVRRVLYRLPKIMAAHRLTPVLIVEGEKDVHAAEGLGFVATTNAMGAGRWLSEYSLSMSERRCVVIPDADQPGQDHAVTVAGSLLLHGAASIRIVELPDQPAHGDLSDWVARGGTRQDLIDLCLAVPEWASALAPTRGRAA